MYMPILRFFLVVLVALVVHPKFAQAKGEPKCAYPDSGVSIEALKLAKQLEFVKFNKDKAIVTAHMRGAGQLSVQLYQCDYFGANVLLVFDNVSNIEGLNLIGEKVLNDLASLFLHPDSLTTFKKELKEMKAPLLDEPLLFNDTAFENQFTQVIVEFKEINGFWMVNFNVYGK